MRKKTVAESRGLFMCRILPAGRLAGAEDAPPHPSEGRHPGTPPACRPGPAQE